MGSELWASFYTISEFSSISGKTVAGTLSHVFLKGNLAMPLVTKALKSGILKPGNSLLGIYSKEIINSLLKIVHFRTVYNKRSII